VVRALNSVNTSLGFEAGLVIVVVPSFSTGC
jgi:ABC-type proline/glycine betaine transport system permease subunit